MERLRAVAHSLAATRSPEKRVAAQFRVDFRVNDDLTVYAAYQKADRHVANVDNTLNLGSPAYNQAGTFTQAALAADSNALITPRTVNTGLGYSFNSTGLCGAPTVSGTGTTQTTTGCGVASDMTNVVVDDTPPRHLVPPERRQRQHRRHQLQHRTSTPGTGRPASTSTTTISKSI